VAESPAAPESSAAPESPAAPDTAVAPKRRRGRTGRLLAGAAVLGLVAGTCTGYLVQADREPTKLPSLSQPTLEQSRGKSPEPLSAALDRKVKFNGDLRKLLLKKPAGARTATLGRSNDGWMSLDDYADEFTSEGEAFRNLVATEFRRAATVEWREGDRHIEIRLVQYRQEETRAAAESADDAYYWAEDEGNTKSWPIPGTGDGTAYVHNRPVSTFGLNIYSAEAHAWRGDVAMEIWIYDRKPIPSARVRDLAKQQMERL
jgi:hypothetical protein